MRDYHKGLKIKPIEYIGTRINCVSIKSSHRIFRFSGKRWWRYPLVGKKEILS